MDLQSEAQRLQLDVLSVEVCASLRSAGLPHVILKGPSTAHWLYAEPRSYNDVDVLVPASTLDRVVAALSGVADARAGGVGEEAEHSLLLHSARGFEVDLHVSLPTLPPMGDRLWTVLSPHLDEMSLDVGRIPVLDLPGRCLVLCLHALNSGVQVGKPLEDLRRARRTAPSDVWVEALAMAEALDAVDLVRAGLSLLGEPLDDEPSFRAYLHLTRAPASTIALERLARVPLSGLPRAVAREVLPTTGFMRNANPDLSGAHLWLVRAHARRWRRLARELPSALGAWRAGHARSGRRA